MNMATACFRSKSGCELELEFDRDDAMVMALSVRTPEGDRRTVKMDSDAVLGLLYYLVNWLGFIGIDVTCESHSTPPLPKSRPS